jgi:hypothetical protein
MMFLMTVLSLALCQTISQSSPIAPYSGIVYAYGQPVEPDTARTPEQLYADATLLSQHLFNGPRYHIYDRTAETHQFFKTRELIRGTLRYDGRMYGPFQMHYDTHFGQLVVRQPENGYLVRLDSSKIEHFTLGNDYFEKITTHPQLPNGIYQRIYNGDTPLLCLRKKQRIEKIVDMKVNAIFTNADAFFVYFEGNYHRIQSKKDLYRLFPSRKSELRALLRNSELSFKDDMETGLLNAGPS